MHREIGWSAVPPPPKSINSSVCTVISPALSVFNLVSNCGPYSKSNRHVPLTSKVFLHRSRFFKYSVTTPLKPSKSIRFNSTCL